MTSARCLIAWSHSFRYSGTVHRYTYWKSHFLRTIVYRYTTGTPIYRYQYCFGRILAKSIAHRIIFGLSRKLRADHRGICKEIPLIVGPTLNSSISMPSSYWKTNKMHLDSLQVLEAVAEDEECSWQGLPLTSFSADQSSKYRTQHSSLTRSTHRASLSINIRTISCWLRLRRSRKTAPSSSSSTNGTVTATTGVASARCSSHRFRVNGEREMRRQLLLLVLLISIVLFSVPLIACRVTRRDAGRMATATTGIIIAMNNNNNSNNNSIFLRDESSPTGGTKSSSLSRFAASWIAKHAATKINTVPVGFP